MSQLTHLSIFYSEDFFRENFVFEVLRYHVGVGSGSEAKTSSSEATVKLKIDNEIRHTVAEGNGPVSAFDHAFVHDDLEKDFPKLRISACSTLKFEFWKVIWNGCNNQSSHRINHGERTWGTVGVSDNVITASWEALVDSVSYKILLDSE